MRLLFKQRLFSWFDSYDIYNEYGETVYQVQGKLDWGHCLKIYDGEGMEVGTVKEKILTFLPKFELFLGNQYVGSINKELTFLKPKFSLDFNGWTVEGNWLEWDYQISDADGDIVAVVSKQVLNWSDTYIIDVDDRQDPLCALMIVLAIDAEKCSRRS